MQLTIRQVPEEIERKLKKNAEKWGLSVNKTLLKILDQALTPSPGLSAKKRDLSAFRKPWSQREAAKMAENLHEFEKIDPGIWQ